MSTSTLLLFYAAWLLAAGAIALTCAVVATEVLSAIGIVDRSGASYGLSLNIITAVTFVVLAAIPFVFRQRFQTGSEEPTEPA
jgi:hypothetical protein